MTSDRRIVSESIASDVPPAERGILIFFLFLEMHYRFFLSNFNLLNNIVIEFNLLNNAVTRQKTIPTYPDLR